MRGWGFGGSGDLTSPRSTVEPLGFELRAPHAHAAMQRQTWCPAPRRLGTATGAAAGLGRTSSSLLPLGASFRFRCLLGRQHQVHVPIERHEPARRSMHGACPVVKGEKWSMTKWWVGAGGV